MKNDINLFLMLSFSFCKTWKQLYYKSYALERKKLRLKLLRMNLNWNKFQVKVIASNSFLPTLILSTLLILQ